jgi:hypothetical protein
MKLRRRLAMMLAAGLVATSLGIAFRAQGNSPTQASTATEIRKDLVLTLDAAQSAIHWTLDSSLHTVHGTFVLKRGTVRFDPSSGAASGEIVADATSGRSGNDSRDTKMHQEVLESAKYSEVVFRPDRVDAPSGPLARQGPWNANIHGVFVLHGAEHEMSIPAQGEFTADHWKGKAKFSIPFIAWGLKNPSNFLLKVNPSVDVELDMSGSLQPATTAK